MDYLYINLPRISQFKINFLILKPGDSLEVRINELSDAATDALFLGLESTKLKIELSFKKYNDAYGSIQIFQFN
jgi:hypothetical protein